MPNQGENIRIDPVTSNHRNLHLKEKGNEFEMISTVGTDSISKGSEDGIKGVKEHEDGTESSAADADEDLNRSEKIESINNATKKEKEKSDKLELQKNSTMHVVKKSDNIEQTENDAREDLNIPTDNNVEEDVNNSIDIQPTEDLNKTEKIEGTENNIKEDLKSDVIQPIGKNVTENLDNPAEDGEKEEKDSKIDTTDLIPQDDSSSATETTALDPSTNTLSSSMPISSSMFSSTSMPPSPSIPTSSSIAPLSKEGGEQAEGNVGVGGNQSEIDIGTKLNKSNTTEQDTISSTSRDNSTKGDRQTESGNETEKEKENSLKEEEDQTKSTTEKQAEKVTSDGEDGEEGSVKLTSSTTEVAELDRGQTVTPYSPLVSWDQSTFVITGGRNEFMINLNTVEKLELESSCVLTPVTIKRMPFAIYDHMSFFLTDRFVFCGGHKRPAVVSNQCFGLKNVPGANWTELPNIPELIFDSADTTIGNTAYIIGGFIKAPSDTVFSFNGETEEWRREPSLSRGRYASCAVSFGDTIYVIGEGEVSGHYDVSLWQEVRSTQKEPRVST